MVDNDVENRVLPCKVIVLGENDVGKTKLINSIINNNIFEENVISTIGSSYAVKTITFNEYQGKSIRFEIWDTAGQEKFRSLRRIFYSDADVAILVYDITNRKSFDEIINYWYQEVIENAKEDISKFNINFDLLII